jgi:hypothetical protein
MNFMVTSSVGPDAVPLPVGRGGGVTVVWAKSEVEATARSSEAYSTAGFMVCLRAKILAYAREDRTEIVFSAFRW